LPSILFFLSHNFPAVSCLDQIVSLGLCPDDGESLSGYKLIDAPGITLKNLSNIADDSYIQGTTLAMAKKSMAINFVRNDLLASLQVNEVANMTYNKVYDCAEFVPGMNMGQSALERGVTIHTVKYRQGGLRQTRIKAIQVYPLTSGDGELKIYDGEYNKNGYFIGKIFSWPVSFVAGQVNTFDESNLSGFDYSLLHKEAKVLIDAPTVSFSSSVLTCLQGCNGTTPNDCGWVDGWDGMKSVKAEGYGINLLFYCECNYDQILCDLSKTFTGELIWTKWQILIFEEQLMSNRFNNWVIYNQEKITDYVIPNLVNQYNARWSALMDGISNILSQYRDDCITCKNKIRWVVNI
jgi:hypothetical protein